MSVKTSNKKKIINIKASAQYNLNVFAFVKPSGPVKAKIKQN
tara:strand:- start:1034 stop:1159 length:126 start_codon:yes stop_codon:yes gene_type:complete